MERREREKRRSEIEKEIIMWRDEEKGRLRNISRGSGEEKEEDKLVRKKTERVKEERLIEG